MHFQRENTIYSYCRPMMIERCVLPPGSWAQEKEMKSGVHGTFRGGETAHQTIISGPVYLPVWSISQAADESLMSRLRRGPALLNALYL